MHIDCPQPSRRCLLPYFGVVEPCANRAEHFTFASVIIHHATMLELGNRKWSSTTELNIALFCLIFCAFLLLNLVGEWRFII